MPCGIYSITNTVNNRLYVGSSQHVARRKREHMWLLRNGIHHCTPLQRAWFKYGEDAFVFELHLTCRPSELLEYEQCLLGGLRDLYNTARTAGAPMRGRKQTPEAKAKIAAAGRGRKVPPETRAKISAAHKGKKKSAAQAARHSATMRGRKPSAETLAKLSAIRRGKKKTAEHIENNAAARRGAKRSPEFCAKMSALAKARAAARKTNAA